MLCHLDTLIDKVDLQAGSRKVLGELCGLLDLIRLLVVIPGVLALADRRVICEVVEVIGEEGSHAYGCVGVVLLGDLEAAGAFDLDLDNAHRIFLFFLSGLVLLDCVEVKSSAVLHVHGVVKVFLGCVQRLARTHLIEDFADNDWVLVIVSTSMDDFLGLHIEIFSQQPR